MKLKNKLRSSLVALGLTVASLVAIAPAQEAAAATCVDSMWRLNSRGTCVKSIQALYNYHHGGKYASHTKKWYPTIAVDGIFGPKTDRAVRDFQGYWYGLRVDGIVGPASWRVLCQAGMGDSQYPYRVPRSYPITHARNAGCPGAQYFYHG